MPGRVPGPPRLAVFDLDGTLVPKTTVCLHLAEWVGHLDALRELEGRYAAHEISNTEVAALDAPHYAGLSLDDVDRRLDSIPCIAGISETVEGLRRRGMEVLLATVTWRFAAEHFARRYGFDAVCGCEMTVTDGRRLGGAVARHIEAEDKLAFVAEYAEARGISLDECVAVGDSRSDLPLFGAVGLAIALNATPAAVAAAHVAIETDDLRDVLAAIPDQ